MKILHLTTFLDFGGIERKKENLSAWTDDNEWIFVAINKGGVAERQIKNNGKKTVCLNLPYKIVSLKTIIFLYKFLKKEKPTVLHLAGSEANFYGTIAGKLAKTPKIICEDWGSDSHSKIADFIFKYIFKLSDLVIAESTLVANKIIKKYTLSKHKVTTVFNFIDSKNLNSNLNRNFSKNRSIISVSRLVEKKRIDISLNVMHRLMKEGYSFKFEILGDGPLLEALKKQSENLGLSEFVKFQGFVNNPLPVIQNSDVYLSTSNNEGFSNALLEAMSLGLVSVVTNVGGVKDVVINGQNGFISDINDEDQIYNNLKKVLNMNDLELQDISNNALTTIRKSFSLENHISELMKIYKK